MFINTQQVNPNFHILDNEIEYLKKQFEDHENRLNVFYCKQKKYQEDLKNEQKVSEQIRQMMPVVFNDNNGDPEVALDMCKNVFKEFYENVDGSESKSCIFIIKMNLYLFLYIFKMNHLKIKIYGEHAASYLQMYQIFFYGKL